ncbi:ArsB/NhaD family transporter [Thermospira aquatica]|uniref:ArsB/NhaD family transporter n=1 Tax=Thermospira aquatica TaxID=2828656 RepID=A0AAX3BD38_9SPIR|nr:ArsB/NhaD family transporter [Thermospira aquatica]URA10095.1 ArsB/NhaD family transporter [Thermospira aquatica]
MTWPMWIAVGIFVVLYIGISLEKVNKTILALLGAGIFVLFHFLEGEKVFAAVDWNVIFLLVSMMVIVAITKQTGIFQYVAIKLAKLSRGNPMTIMVLLSLATAVFSAFLDNVTTVLIFVPVAILIAQELDISPLPYVVALAMASNVGGTATLIGDPPNIMIASAAGLSFNSFLAHLAPVALFLLISLCGFLWLLFHKQMRVSNEKRARIMNFDETKVLTNPALIIKSLSILGMVILGFFLHGVIDLEPSMIALLGAALLMLLATPHEIEELLHEVEWATILFFVGLFILIGGLVEIGVMKILAERIVSLTRGSINSTAILLVWMSGIFSAVVDNIPYVATMIPLIKEMGASLGGQSLDPLWWSLALGACLGGNGTLVGASANVVSVGIAKKSGIAISFWDFTKYGLLYTLLSLLVSSLYVYFRYFVLHL